MAHSTSIYRDYHLSCRPMVLEDGTFQARVAIICLSGDKTRSQRFLDLEIFASEEVAIERARTVGMDWIDANAKSNESALNPISGRIANRPQG
jgi:hypothetical protein